AIETAYGKGWNLIKLYFMIGLPTETDQDIRELVDLIREVGKIGKKFKGGKNVNASIGTFVPKSFTPFQWDRFEDLKVINERLNYLKAAVRFPFARLKWHDPKECFIEGVLSRGDRSVGRALLKAYELGCRFDGWAEMFNYDLWLKAFDQTGVDPHFYNREIALNEVLPWDFIDIGVSKKFLLKERQRSYEQIQTYDCKWGDCSGCGIPGNYADIKLAATPTQNNRPPLDRGGLQGGTPETGLALPLAPSLCKEGEHSGQLVQLTLPGPRTSVANGQASAAVATRNDKNGNLPMAKPFILHYAKEGPARFLSHLN